MYIYIRERERFYFIFSTAVTLKSLLRKSGFDAIYAWTDHVLPVCVLRCVKMGSPLYLSCEDATEADDDQDVEDRRAHDGAHPHVPLGDEHSWSRGNRENVK